MNAKDHDAVQKRKSPLSGKPAPISKSPVPVAGVKLQQGTTADMQHNVGNSGLKDLLAEQQPGAAPLRAQAKADATALGKKAGKQADPAARGNGVEPDEKQKSVLDADASRKKKEVESARHKAAAEAAKPTLDKVKVPPAAHAAVDPPAGEKEQAAKKPPPPKSTKKPALAKAVVAKEAEAEHAKAKVDVAKSLVGRKQNEVADTSRVASAKLAESGKRAAIQASSLVAAQVKVEGEEALHAVQAVPKSPKPVRGKSAAAAVERPGGPGGSGVSSGGAKVEAKGTEAKGKAAEGKVNARRGSHLKRVELADDAKRAAEDRAEQVKGRKVAAESKAAAEPDVAKQASHAKAAASEAEAERSADERVGQKAREVDQIESSRELDKSIDEVSRAADLEAHDGGQVTLVGVYVPRPSEAGGPQLGHVSVMVGDQEVRLGNEVRGTAEILRLSGERVFITGKLDLKKPPGQALDPSRREKPVLTGFRTPHAR